MGIDGLCQKYSRETCQISEFQEKHRKRLLTFYREKITKLEESLRKSVLRMEQLQSMRLSQQTAFSAIKTPVSTPSAKPGGHPLLPLDSSASDRVEFMQVDHTPSPMRKSPLPLEPPPKCSLAWDISHGSCGFLVLVQVGSVPALLRMGLQPGPRETVGVLHAAEYSSEHPNPRQ
ncbi:probable E3 SUMO-protein ligase RNF212 [Leptonychotes weddellii]|uniref:Probable E3 SUMO-protein ligase RNF212 n=1 Tax=Leptonychotes weddellii TaxID=9713 RepID=A0A7F8PXC0_LEPWE|nr:probable E3 SUMO-protein ligase RNF212 [Leptonychotes weddellii]